MGGKMTYIRKAKEKDRPNVALCIAEGFEKDFSVKHRKILCGRHKW